MKSTTLSVIVIAATMGIVPIARSAEPTANNVAEIQAKHDRAFIRELSDYLRQHPKADDRDQAYAALFNKAIEHDWFSEAEELGQQYLKSDPNGPVKALAQIILTMGRAQAGRFDEALVRYRELIGGLDQNEQEEFATSFSENLANESVAAGEFGVAREVYTLLLSKFKDSPNLRQKVEREQKRLDKVGKAAPSFTTEDIHGKTVRLEAYRGKYVLIDFWATWCAPCIAELPRVQAAYRTYHDAGFEVIAISLDDSKTAVVDFAKARNIPWPQLHNASGSADLVEGFGVSSIPATYLIDPQGTVIRIDLRGKALDEVLGRLIKTPVRQARKP
jgi:peroxiredoxin